MFEVGDIAYFKEPFLVELPDLRQCSGYRRVVILSKPFEQEVYGKKFTSYFVAASGVHPMVVVESYLLTSVPNDAPVI